MLCISKVRCLKGWDSLEAPGIRVDTVPPYNLNKLKSTRVPFHPRNSKGRVP